MIYSPQFCDTADIVMLSYSVITCIQQDERLTLDVEEVSKVVNRAAEIIPGLCKQDPDNWDGPLWLEWFEETKTDGCLASMLAWCCSEDINVDAIVTLWLRQTGL